MKTAQRSVALCLIFVIFCSLLPSALAASTGTINTDKVFFRVKPNTKADYYSLLKKGTAVTVTGTSGSFYSVTCDGHSGYVMKKFVTLSADSAKETSAAGSNSTKTKESKYVTASHISDLGSVPAATKKGSKGDAVEKLQQALKIKGYYSGVVDGVYGNGTAACVKKFQAAVGLNQTGTADKTTLQVLFDKVSAAEAAKTSKSKAKTTTVSSDPKMNGITQISQIKVPATTAKGSSGKNVLALQQALKIKGYYTAPINSKFDDATVEAVKAYQKAHHLCVDGIAGNSTIKSLFGTNASNYAAKTEKLNWFRGGVNRIPNGATFQVKDVATGKVFTARRLFGSNHMDSEPLTKQDTATLTSIYGGYSWARRPILVRYQGRIYAASMNGMPHGTTTVDNNFPGHFCIHFSGSKTHGTKKVDAAHQSAVKRALKASW